jgi:steroid delta-isomerase-like uncharacterized protein
MLRLGLGLFLAFSAFPCLGSAHSQRARGAAETEQNKVLVRLWINAGFNKRDPDIVDKTFAETFAINGHEMRREDLKRMMRGRLTAFPDLEVTIDECIGEGKKVGIWYTARGTHRGVFDDVAPTGRYVTWTGFDLFEIERGRIVKGRFVDDSLGLMRQLGARLVLPTEQGPD